MESLLDIWKTNAGIAEALDLPYSTVQSWGPRGIPRKRYTEIIEAAKRDGHTVSLEDLVNIQIAAVA